MTSTLIVSPAFHGYWRSIEDALRRRGHDVSTVCYDAYDTMTDKIRLKVTVELPERLRGAHGRRDQERARLTERVIEALRQKRPQRVLVIKGDDLDDRFWDALNDTPRALWLYDDLHRHRYSLDFLRALSPVFSYSRSETEQLRADGVDASFLPDAFDPHRAEPSPRRSGLVAFVGSGYANRFEILGELGRRGLPVHAWGRGFSRHPLDRLRTWSWSRPPIAASRDISLEQAYTVMGEAAAAVNIHGLQTGHAMRTFEIPGMGGVQLVDRADVNEFYDIGTEVLVWKDVDELAELATRAVADPAWTEPLRSAGCRRTLAEHTFDHRLAALEERWS